MRQRPFCRIFRTRHNLQWGSDGGSAALLSIVAFAIGCALLALLILEHRLSSTIRSCPPRAGLDWEGEAAGLIFAKRKLSLAEVGALLGG